MIDKRHELLLVRMYDILSQHPRSIRELKKEIGMSFYTIQSFFDGKKLRLQSLSKIEGWMNKQEKDRLTKKS